MYNSSKDKYTTPYELLDNGKTKKLPKQLNSTYVNSPRPKWCIKKFKNSKDLCPSYKCLSCDCKFLAYSNVEEKDYKIMMKAWWEANKNEETK